MQEVTEPVKVVGSQESDETSHKSQSVQCTNEGSEECGTDTDMHSYTLDSGMVCVCIEILI